MYTSTQAQNHKGKETYAPQKTFKHKNIKHSLGKLFTPTKKKTQIHMGIYIRIYTKVQISKKNFSHRWANNNKKRTEFIHMHMHK